MNYSLVQYWDKTPHELSYEIQGYNDRWESQMMIERLHYTLHYNIHAAKGKGKTAKELMPLPSDAPKSKAEKRLQEMLKEAEFATLAKKR